MPKTSERSPEQFGVTKTPGQVLTFTISKKAGVNASRRGLSEPNASPRDTPAVHGHRSGDFGWGQNQRRTVP